MERLGTETLAIFWSAPTRVFSADVDYEYRQDSNLLYLTGIDQEETILVLMPGNESRKEILFIREADARREHWNGHSLTPAEATAESGIQTVLSAAQFDGFVAAMLSKRPMGGTPDRVHQVLRRSHRRKAKVAVLMEPQSLSEPPSQTRSLPTGCANGSPDSTSPTRRRS